MWLSLLFGVLVSLSLTLPSQVQAAAPGEVDFDLVVPAVERPVSITHAGDGSGRLFIVVQSGRIVIFDGTQLLPTPFLDISPLVSCCGELGLLNVAFHPNYAVNGLFYISYTDLGGRVIIARYAVSADPNRADPTSAFLLLEIPQPFPIHKGGQLHFGPDGYLYIGVGDGNGVGDPFNFAQDLGSLSGKILRIDVDVAPPDRFDGPVDGPYEIPADNPFVGIPGVRPEVWTFGFRNPWRFSFDRATGDMFIGDVGEGTAEEINWQAASSLGGENYGWRRMEGNECFNPPDNCDDGTLIPPIIAYQHTGGLVCSVTGGYVYRGALIPALVGSYLYADLCSGQIWGATQQMDGSWYGAELLDTDFLISTFGEDENGNVYFAHYPFAQDPEILGAIYRLVPGPGFSPRWKQVPGPGPISTIASPEAVTLDGNVWVFFTGPLGEILYTTRENGHWTGVHEVPSNGRTLSAPGAVVVDGKLYVFVHGTDNKIYFIVYDNGEWGSWQEVPGNGATFSAPTAAGINGRIYLFVRGTDNKLYEQVYENGSWTFWREVPGNGATPVGPHAVGYGDTVHLIVRGTDNKIYHNLYTPVGWTGWMEVPGIGATFSRPSAVVFQNWLKYIVRGTDNKIYINHFHNSIWSGWQEVEGIGATLSGLGATATEMTYDIYAHGTDGFLYINQDYDG